MKDCIIVGGGAAGMVAAIEAKRAGAKSVLLVEKQACLGKKLSQTGNGRANYTNLSMNANAYRSNHPEYIPSFLKHFDSRDSLEYFKTLGIYPKFRGDYVYPYSDQAKSMVQCLENALHNLGVEICLQHRVEAISWTEKEGFFLKGKKLLPKGGSDSSFPKDNFSVSTPASGNKEKNKKREKNKKEKIEWEEKVFSLQGRKLLIASGGLAMEALGASGEGYEIAKSLSHTVSNLFPSLVPIYTKEDYVKLWAGVRVDVRAELYKEQDLIFQDEGELQCTDYGISGIIVFQMSRLVHRLLEEKAKSSLELSFLPKFEEKEAKNYFLKRKELLEKEKGDAFLLGLFPEKLSQVLYERTAFPIKQRIQDISDQKILELCHLCLHFPFYPERIGDFQRAQCTAGGVNLSEIFIPEFQSKKNPDLYFAGEVLDVDGICGGYNLHFAFGSGILAGRAMGKKND